MPACLGCDRQKFLRRFAQHDSGFSKRLIFRDSEASREPTPIPSRRNTERYSINKVQKPRRVNSQSLFLSNKVNRRADSKMNEVPYTCAFFETIRGGSRRSAQIVLPIVLGMLESKSVVDVGCGDGTWLSVFRELGVCDTLGLDGAYVDPRQLQIPQDQFRSTDLALPFSLSRSFDLAMSLEVAEHLPPQSADAFVDSLTQLAPVVLFSAAIPLQGGTQHLNEQWPEYWATLFKARDYLPIDCIRARIWANEQVEWYYAQNLLLFAKASFIQEHMSLHREYEKTNQHPLALVHPTRLLQPFRCGVRDACHLLAQATMNAVRKRIPGLPGERY
jgi:SAM-dependent methyltransferase